MEPNKFETQFREKLNSREIKPSEMAWSKLDAMLSVSEKPKRKNFTWIYIAASFVGFLLIGTFYFNQKDNSIEIKSNEVVLENEVEPQSTNSPVKSLKAKEEKEKGLVPIVAPKLISGTNRISILKVKLVNNNSNQNQVVQASIKDHSIENNSIVSASANKNYELTTKCKYISAEKLLSEVSNTKYETKAYDKTTERTRKGIEVNANSLLSNAETELDQSFRDSALQRLNKNFNAIKTVLVNRNYEE